MKKARVIRRKIVNGCLALIVTVGVELMCFDRLQGANVKECCFPMLLSIVIAFVSKELIELFTDWLD